MTTKILCNECARYSSDKGDLKCFWCNSENVGIVEIPEITLDELKQQHEYNSK